MLSLSLSSLHSIPFQPQLASNNAVGDLLPEVALRAGREVALPVRGRRPGRSRLHVVHRHRGDRRRQVSRRRPLGQVRERVSPTICHVATMARLRSMSRGRSSVRFASEQV